MNLEIMEIANIKNDFNKSFSEINITQKKSLFIKSLDNRIFNFEKFSENLNVINQMYSFFMGNQLNFKEVSFSVKNKEDEAFQVIKIYFPQRITFSNQRYLLDYDLVKESLPNIIEMFDESYSLLEKILSGHLNSSIKNFFEVDDFLQASRNIEVFSRTFSNVEEKNLKTMKK